MMNRTPTFLKSDENNSKSLLKILSSTKVDVKELEIIISKIGKVSEQEKFELEEEILYFYHENINKTDLENLEDNLELYNNNFFCVEDILEAQEDNKSLLFSLIISNLKKIKFSDEKYKKLLKDNIEKEQNELKKVDKKYKLLKQEISTYKFDIVGLIAGTLSLFTIFGVDYSIIINLVSKDKFTGRQFITMFILLNLTVILILRILLFTLKELFSYNYNFKFKKHILDIIILGIIFIIFYIYKYM